MKNYKFTISGNTYEVEINSFEDNTIKLEVNGTPYTVELHREVRKTKTPILMRAPVKEPPREKIDKKEGGSPTPVRAPLPGNIVEVYVKEGDIVKKDQKLLLMEAMKMENVIMAEADGVIESVKVKPGDAVLQGDVLIETI
ncbi:MAG TPA: acetyl-CoA carboxylase biotin carboxyl carrier protein subunit [Bacteroidetes bacterium]|nr:acetyl-CoA carboxylase biotin carboxyl carrier protein subunit [Bacteroidota bacterium]